MRRFAIVILGVMVTVISSAPAAFAGTETLYYYPDDNGWPDASLKTGPPTNPGPMPDIDGNGKQGRRIAKSDKGLSETDPRRYHQWSVPADGLEITGSASLTIWFADKSFHDGDDNRLVAYLLDCASGCTTLATTSKDVSPPDGENVFSQTTLTFPAFDHEFASGRDLRLRIMIDKDFSDDDMTFAYDTTDYRTRLKLSKVVPTTTTTTTATTTSTSTTTTSLPTTTTTTPPTTTTTANSTTATESTTTTTASTTTQGPETTTTTTSTTSTTSSGPTTTTAAAGTDSPSTTLPPPPQLDTEKTNLVIKTTPAQRGVLVGAASVEMTPVEGLMVTFVSAAETVRNNLLSSVGLGLIMASLLVIGMSRRAADDQPKA